jgi:hypothetical protein
MTMKRIELVQALTGARQQLDTALAGLTEAQLAQPGAVAGWSVQDTLTHVTAWAAELVTGLAKLKRGAKGLKLNYTDAEIEAMNDKIYRENRNRPLDRVLADYHGVHKQLLRQVEALSDKEIAGPRPQGEQPMGEWIVEWVADHEREHAAHIAAWRRSAGNG